MIGHIAGDETIRNLYRFTLHITIRLIRVFELTERNPSIVLRRSHNDIITSFGINRSYFLVYHFHCTAACTGLGLRPSVIHLAHISRLRVLDTFLQQSRKLLQRRRGEIFHYHAFPPYCSIIVRSKVESLSFVYLREIFRLLLADIVLYQHLGTI